MIPVLNRLREAADAYQEHVTPKTGPVEVLAVCAEAVLDAPTGRATDVHSWRDGDVRRWSVTVFGIGEPSDEMPEMVALVPVKGEE